MRVQEMRDYLGESDLLVTPSSNRDKQRFDLMASRHISSGIKDRWVGREGGWEGSRVIQPDAYWLEPRGFF